MSNPVFMVNFLIVGAQKCGTTALASFLSQHPEICFAPNKEIHLFDKVSYQDSWSVEDVNKEYRSNFPNFNGQYLIGEGTPIYMYLPFIAQRIFQYNPGMKLIFLLRNPIVRAISQYVMEKKRGDDKLPFCAAIELERFRLWRDRNNLSEHSSLRNHGYLSRGLYTKQIMNLLRFFPKRQMLFLKTEDMLNDHHATLLRTYNFLGVNDKSFMPIQQKVFVTEKCFHINEYIISKMIRRLFSDMIELEPLLGWNLTDWKTPDSALHWLEG